MENLYTTFSLMSRSGMAESLCLFKMDGGRYEISILFRSHWIFISRILCNRFILNADIYNM